MPKESDLVEAAGAIKILLSHLEIKHVISVDDAYAPSIENISIFLVEDPGGIAVNAALSDLDAGKPTEVFRAEIEKRLAGLAPEVLEQIRVALLLRMPRDDAEDLYSLARLFQDDAVRYECMSLRTWKKAYSDLTVLGRQGRALVLFDQSFVDEGDTDVAGIREVKALLQGTDSSQVVTGLLTNKCAIGEECHDWQKLAASEGLDVHRFLYIAKERLDEDFKGFALMLKLTALSPRCEKLLEVICKAAGESFEEAVKSCRTEVTVFDFEHIVFALSGNEGVWEPETVLRILFHFLRVGVTTKIRGTDDVKRMVEEVRAISQINTEPVVKTKHTSWKIQRSEMYDWGSHINTLHLPLELGDVFVKPGKGKDRLYVVIAQPCDLMVRGGGKRGGRCAEEVVLCQVEPSEAKQSYKLPYWTVSGDAWWVNLASRITVNPCMLDLAVFSDSGDTKMALDNQPDNSLIPAWFDRFGLLQRQAKKIIEDFETLKKMNVKDDQARLVIPSASLDGKMRPSVDIATKSLDFGLKRFARIRQPWAGGLLKEYASHLAREAFEMDLGQEFPVQPAAVQAPINA